MDIAIAKNSLITAPSKVLGQLTDLSIGLEIWNSGGFVSGVRTYAATIKYATNAFTLYINGDVDSRIGSSGVMDCNGVYTTMLLVSHHINSVDGWHCRLKGVLLSDSADATIIEVAEANCLRVAVQFPVSSADMETHCYCISNAKGVTSIPGGLSYADKVRAIYDEGGAANCLFYLKVTPTFTGTNCTMTIYSINGATETENLIGSMVLVATTNPNTYDFTAMPITALPGERLIVRLVADTNLASVTENLAVGKSILT